MRAATCLWCGAPSIEGHHLSGRGPDGAYLDDLIVPLCKSHHDLVHVLLRRLGIDWPPSGMPLLEYRVRRLAVHLDVSTRFGRPFSLVPPAARSGHDLLVEAADALAVGR